MLEVGDCATAFDKKTQSVKNKIVRKFRIIILARKMGVETETAFQLLAFTPPENKKLPANCVKFCQSTEYLDTDCRTKVTIDRKNKKKFRRKFLKRSPKETDIIA